MLLTKPIFLPSLMWCVVGVNGASLFSLPSSSKRQSATVFGAFNLARQSFYWKKSDRGNAKSFIAFLHQLRQRFKGKHLLIILDNASYHRSKAVKRFLLRHPEVELLFLPPYSPEYNPVEQIWGWLKRKVCEQGAGTKGIAAVISKIRKWCWHWREDNLSAPLHVGLGLWSSLFI